MSKSISDKSILGALTVNDKNVPVISYSDTTPTSPAVGDLWFNTSNGYTYLYYNDGSSSQWVSISTSGAGAQGVVSTTSPLSYNSSTQNISLDTVPVSSGGTGATTASTALSNLGAAPIASPSFTGDVSTTGKISVNASAGDEGGEIFLNKPVTNTSISGGVTVDVYQNRLRFFEQGGSNRGYYIDISKGNAGVGADIGSSGLISIVPTATYVGSGSASVASNGMVTFSGTNYITFAGAFSSAYDRYQVQISGYSGPATYLGMRGATNGSGNSAAAYYDGGMYRQGGGVGIWTNQSGTTQMQVGYVPSNEWWQATVEVINPNNGNACTFMNRAFYMGGSGTTVITDGKFNGTSAFDGLQFWCTGGGTFAGQIRIMAYRK